MLSPSRHPHSRTKTCLQWGTVFALICLLLTACGSFSTAALGVQTSEPLRLSLRADRAQAAPLGPGAVTGEVYIFAAAPKTVHAAHFYLDGKLVRQSAAAPFDLMGGTLRSAKPLDTRTLKNGRHALRVSLLDKRGKRVQLGRTFTVNNSVIAPSKPAAASRWQPEPGLEWQWQLQGELDLSLKVDVYDLDLFDTPASTVRALQARGKRVICYFSAGSFEAWRGDAGSFPAGVKGKKMDGWDELWLDIRNVQELAPIMRARLELAARKGCDGVEPDNVDAYSNDSGFPLSGADQLTYNRFLASEAHARGLAIGLKNDLEQVRMLEPHFDFAVNEQCFQYSECALLTPFIKANKAVFGAEYERSTASFCPTTTALGLNIIKKRYDLGSYREACP